MSTPTLAFKSASIVADEDAAARVIAAAEGIVAAAPEHEGLVTAIVSVTGVIDEVDDIIEPGAYRETLLKRMPKVCWHHSWEHPIGKVLHIEELLPGDSRLPKTTRDGKAWPAEAGALVAVMQMNMKSERGREAFEAIQFYSESGECEYSIGYKVPAGKSTRDAKGVRRIKVMDLFELSFVLFGAHTMTGTLSLKAAVNLMHAALTPGRTITLSRKAIDDEFERLMADVDLGETDMGDEGDLEPEPDEPTAVGPDDQEVLDIGDDEGDEEAALHAAALADPEFELAGEAKAEGGTDQNRGGAENLRHAYLHGKIAVQIGWGTDGDFLRCADIAGKHMTPEQAKGYCNLRHQDAVGAPPGQGHPEGKVNPQYDQPETTAPDTDAPDAAAKDPKHTGVMVALYPDPEAAKQIAVRGGEEPEELHVTLAFLGDSSDQAGEGLSLEAATSKIVAAAQMAAATHKPLSGTVGGVGKFPDMGDGVPVIGLVDVVGLGALREDLVAALTDAQLPVKTDHGFTPHMTLGYNLDMSLIPDTDPVPVDFTDLVVCVGGTHTRIPLGSDLGAEASGAPIAGAPMPGEQMAGDPTVKGYDPMIETGPDAGHKAAVPSPGGKSFPRLPGTLEERTQAISAALDEALLGDLDDEARKQRYINIDGTWMDRVICTVNHWTSGSADECQSYEFPYTIDDDDDTVTLGEPTPVKLSLTAEVDGDEVDDDVPIGDLLPLAEMIQQVTAGLKTLGAVEIKAGRVLSANNAARLKSVVETLITVLSSAGIDIVTPAEAEPVSPTVDMETTAPSAHGKAMPTPADVAALLASIDSITAEAE